jgi:hypothetical protein
MAITEYEKTLHAISYYNIIYRLNITTLGFVISLDTIIYKNALCREVMTDVHAI